MKKHSKSIQAIQTVVDALVQKHGTKLLFSGTIAILNDEHTPERVELIQYGIRNGLILMLEQSLTWTRNETEDFIESKPVTFN